MEAELRQTDDLTLVGMSTPFRHVFSDDSNAMEVIPPLWDRFLRRQDEVPHRDGTDVYGYMFSGPDPSHEDELLYLVGVPVTAVDVLPDDMVARTLPGGLFAVFRHEGDPTALEQTVRRIYAEWLPNSGYEHTQDADVEHFSERRTRHAQVPLEYWISVRAKG